MEGPTFHRLATIISFIEHCFNLYIIGICFYGVGCFENTRFQWNQDDKTYQYHPCSGKLNIEQVSNGVSEFSDVHNIPQISLFRSFLKNLPCNLPEEIDDEIYKMLLVELFATLFAYFGLYFTYGPTSIWFLRILGYGHGANLSKNILWHIFKNVCLIVMSLGVILNDFSRISRNNSGIDNDVSCDKSFVMLMIFGVMFPMLVTIFDWKYYSFIRQELRELYLQLRIRRDRNVTRGG